MKKDPSLKAQASAIFIGNLIGTVFQFLIPAIIVRLISQEDFGIFRQFTLVAGTFEGLLGFGVASSLYFFYPIADQVGKQRIIQQTQWLISFNLLVFILVFYFFGDEILIHLNFSEFINVKNLIVFYLIFMMLSSIVSNIFTLEKNTLLNKIYPPLEKMGRFLIFLITILVVPGFKGPILALVFFAAARFIYISTHISPYYKRIYSIDWNLLKRQVLYSLPFGLALILNLGSTTFDKFFINQYISPAEFGIYSISFLSIPILKQFFASIHNVVVPQISISMSNGNLKEAILLWQKTVDKTSSITIPAVILFWILAKEIITILYTEEYVEAANYYRVFILMFFVSMFSHEIILRGANKTRFILYSNLIGTTITIIAGLIMIPKFGLYGAISTALLGTVLPMIVSLHWERKIMKLSIKQWVNWKRIFSNTLICLLIGVPLLFVKDYVSNIYIRTFLVIFIFGFSIVVFQIKYNLFIFEQYIPVIRKYLKI